MEKRRWRGEKVLDVLRRLLPEARTALRYSNPWERLVAVILSAQCTDERVNRVTERLFRKYPTLEHYVKADRQEFEIDIRSTGFCRNKARNILAASRIVRDRYKGQVPNRMEDLVALPGVARKTANVVLGEAFGVAGGIAVDTHVKRLARLLGLREEKKPDKIE
jgi:endonuclease III